MRTETAGEAGAPVGAAAAPAKAGVSLKLDDVVDILEQEDAALAWFEVHPEDFLSGPAAQAGRARLDALRRRRPISLHGVALGIGAERDLDPQHLRRLREMVDRYEPCLFSEHLAWATHGDPETMAQLPPPYDAATLDRVSRHIDQAQEALGRRILLENPSSYIRFTNSTMTDAEFLTAAVSRTGCGLLLDVNNAFISAVNGAAGTRDYLDALPLNAVHEIHLGGHAERLDAEGRKVLEGHHATPEPVWEIYEALIAKIGPKPTLIEWDAEKPDWPRLTAEANRANAILDAAAA
ncbi:MAG: DUF692 domain-containing protein [Pseudomonadota bacterium]